MKTTQCSSNTVARVAVFAQLVAIAIAMSACLPARLQKYRRDGAGNGTSSLSPSESPDMAANSSLSAKGRLTQPTPGPAAANANQANANYSAQQRATIYAVDKQTYRFALRENDIWDSALNVLLRNYNLTIVDRQSGIVTTEWDSYYLDSAVFRNRLSIKISRNSWNTVDVTIHNNVERLRDAAQATGSVGAVWLPADDGSSEISRVVQNMALLLNQPPPVMPPNSQIAKGQTAAGAGINR